jgi:uncharacterized membrane protein
VQRSGRRLKTEDAFSYYGFTMPPFSTWHPVVVHFAIALLATASGALIFARFARSPTVAVAAATTGTWNLYSGALAALTAALSGLAAAFASVCRNAAAMHAISLHFRWALLTTLLFVLIAIGRLAQKQSDAPPSTALVALLALGFVCLCIAGYLGGQNVYMHGIGVVGACRSSVG